MISILGKISRAFLYLLIFLLPIFVLPFTPEIFEFNKIYLLVFLVVLSLIFYLFSLSFSPDIYFRFSILFLPILVFFLINLLSFSFSVDRNVSLLGFYGRFSNGFLVLIFLTIFVFLVLQLFEKIQFFNFLLLLSFAISLFLFYISVFFDLTKIPFLANFVFPGFNPTTFNSLTFSILLSIVTVFLVGLFLNATSNLKRIFYIVFLFFLLWAILGINYRLAILNLFLSLVFLLFAAIHFRVFKEEVGKLFLPTFLILLSLLFLLMPFPFRFGVLGQITLGQKFSWQVALSTIFSSPKNFFLGSGPGTFFYDFTKFKPKNFNQTLFWNLRFDRAQSNLTEILAETGILGFLSFLVLVFLILYVGLLLKSRENLPYLAGFFSAFLAQLFYYQNVPLSFLFWFFCALNLVFFKKLIFEKKFSFTTFPELKVFFFVISSAVFIIFLVFGLIGINFYLAYANQLKLITKTGEERLVLARKSVFFHPNSSFYYIVLSREALNLLFSELQKKEKDQVKIQNLISEAIRSAQFATQISPNYVVAWENLGLVYRDLQNLAQGATEWALKSFEKARDLDSKNPILYTEIGKLHLLLGNIEAAKKNLEIGKNLRSDYWDLNFLEALILEREEKIQEAISKIEQLETNISSVPLLDLRPIVEVKFELGRLYFNQGKTDQAISKFEEIIAIFPNHSNSLYSLALAYEKKGQNEKAIEFLKKVLDLNPGQQEVIEKLEKLQRAQMPQEIKTKEIRK